jgi:hypothetical protein
MPIIEYPYGRLLLELHSMSDLGKVCLHFPAKLRKYYNTDRVGYLEKTLS